MKLPSGDSHTRVFHLFHEIQPDPVIEITPYKIEMAFKVRSTVCLSFDSISLTQYPRQKRAAMEWDALEEKEEDRAHREALKRGNITHPGDRSFLPFFYFPLVALGL